MKMEVKSVSYTTTKKSGRGWSKERRAAQAARCRAQKPWVKSTGPKTAKGKIISARNATKHGLRAAAWVAQVAKCRTLFRAFAQYLKILRRCAYQNICPAPFICALRRATLSTLGNNHGFMALE